MARGKNKDIDAAIANLGGFARKGARVEDLGNIPTGHFSLDFAIHYGILPDKVDLNTFEGYDPSKPLGLPLGRLIEFFGPPGCGKSSVAYRVVGFAQQMGYPCLWIDTEHSFSDSLAEINGVNIDDLFYSELFDPENPDKNFYAEDILDKIGQAAESGIKLIVVDSVANMIPKERFEKEGTTVLIARLSRAIGDNLPKAAHFVAKNGATVIFINQIRTKPGVMFGDPEDSPGGFSLKHNCSVRIKFTNRSSKDALIFKEDDEVEGGQRIIGRYSGAILEKNRMGKPLLDANGKRIALDIPVYYEQYFPNIEDHLFDSGRQLKLISVRKGVYSWGDISVEGRVAFVEHVKSNNLTNVLGREIKEAAKVQGCALPPEIVQMDFGDDGKTDEQESATEKPITRRRAKKDS